MLATDQMLGEALGKIYVDKYFSPATKARVQQMVSNVTTSFRDHLSSLTWMGDQTRKEALTKLDKITAKIGYPDKWRDYSALANRSRAVCDERPSRFRVLVSEGDRQKSATPSIVPSGI